MFWRWCLLDENKKFAENKKKNGEESGWKEEIRMIICKRPAHLDDHLQKAGPSGWSLVKQQQQQQPDWRGGHTHQGDRGDHWPGVKGQKEEKKEKEQEEKKKKE